LAAVEAQLRTMQGRIKATAEALDYCQKASRIAAAPCGKLETQLQRLIAQQRALLVAAAQASGQ
jgi:hypothetical protein